MAKEFFQGENGNWHTRATATPDCSISVHYAVLEVLMDIRRELRQVNQTVCCRNAIRIPAVLDKIEKNTRKKKTRRKPR